MKTIWERFTDGFTLKRSHGSYLALPFVLLEFTIFINRQELPKAACLAWCCLSITGLASLLLLSLRYWIFPAICLPSNIWAVDLSRFPLSLRSASLCFWNLGIIPSGHSGSDTLSTCLRFAWRYFCRNRSWSDRSARRFKWWWWRAGTHNFKSDALAPFQILSVYGFSGTWIVFVLHSFWTNHFFCNNCYGIVTIDWFCPKFQFRRNFCTCQRINRRYALWKIF